MEIPMILYGDGIHDDTSAIQWYIDNSGCELLLPPPKVRYLISKPLILPSQFKLKLPRYAEIKLADGANCFMVQNKTVEKPASRLRDFLTPSQKAFWYYCDLLSIDSDDACHDFEIEGGIWNFNNKNQTQNPIYTGNFDESRYIGHGMFFYNVRNFRIANLTLKDPVNYAVMIDTASYFTFENIVFDFNDGNPIASNMDGIHLNGNCHFGTMRNLKGACYDDLIALNAHEGTGGDITNIEIDGIFAESCHSAVRLLTDDHRISHITISNVFGTYYQYCIGFTKYYPRETEGFFDAISVTNVHASKSRRLPIQEAHMGRFKHYHFPLIDIQNFTRVKRLRIDGLHRREYENPVPTVFVAKNATAEHLILRDISCENFTQSPITEVLNRGTLQTLSMADCPQNALVNEGTISKLIP